MLERRNVIYVPSPEHEEDVIDAEIVEEKKRPLYVRRRMEIFFVLKVVGLAGLFAFAVWLTNFLEQWL